MEFQDQLNRKIEIPHIPKRIVSLVPSQSELLVDLGLENSIAGITKFCVHPQGLRKKKKIVGGTKTVHFDKIKALEPDVILCNKEENTREIVEELEKIAPVHVSDVQTIDEACELMLQYGEIFNCINRATGMVKEIRQKFLDFKKQVQESPKRRVAYFIWKKPMMVAGGQTFINTLLEINNFENVFTGQKRYPETNLADLSNREIDLILLSSEPFPFQEKHKDMFRQLEAKVELVDGEYFSWYGSRLLGAIDYFAALHIHLSRL